MRTADDAVDLEFTPGAVHAEHRDLRLLSSSFVQPVGSFRGSIRHGERRLELDGVLGVVEDQRVRW